MKPRYIVHDDLIAWFGSPKNGRKLLGLSVFTQTVDAFAPTISGANFRRWLVCSQSASGVVSELIATGPPGSFDPLQAEYWPYFAEGNLIACPRWNYGGAGTAIDTPSDLGPWDGRSPDLQTIIRNLGLQLE